MKNWLWLMEENMKLSMFFHKQIKETEHCNTLFWYAPLNLFQE